MNKTTITKKKVKSKLRYLNPSRNRKWGSPLHLSAAAFFSHGSTRVSPSALCKEYLVVVGRQIRFSQPPHSSITTPVFFPSLWMHLFSSALWGRPNVQWQCWCCLLSWWGQGRFGSNDVLLRPAADHGWPWECLYTSWILLQTPKTMCMTTLVCLHCYWGEHGGTLGAEKNTLFSQYPLTSVLRQSKTWQ